ncbi:hypothetical protein E2562_029877 [Oryza meyeriana var. granulata]|uniref:Uncharacterized protein n=1 Tax=Oryza meyeriana var. granulata TaxID=110450 RepID=A0A6G1CUL3_9ORYZ|nr:hypothetical protein E2562_029877 [Oryza meyeriana var. granulata]
MVATTVAAPAPMKKVEAVIDGDGEKGGSGCINGEDGKKADGKVTSSHDDVSNDLTGFDR